MQRLAHQRQHTLALPDAAQLRQQRQLVVFDHLFERIGDAVVGQLADDSDSGEVTAELIKRYFAGRAEVTSFAVADEIGRAHV